MDIRQHSVNGVTVLELLGDIVGDMDRATLAEALQRSRSPIVFNLSGVRRIDSNGIGLILSGYSQVVQNQGWAALAETGGIDALARDLFSRMLKTYPTEAEAVDEMAKAAGQS